LDGLALCRRLKADEATKGAAVVVFSLLSAAARARDAGADAFLPKPLAAQRLVDTVRGLLAGMSGVSDRTPRGSSTEQPTP
jgi:DNA-binding response OmpR family regulator